jgi:hypothetical protein
MASGGILPGRDLAGDLVTLDAFRLLFREACEASQAMIEEAVMIQAQRRSRSLQSAAEGGYESS